MTITLSTTTSEAQTGQKTVAQSTILENSAFALTTLVFGIMAGFFWTYTFNVNFAMLETNAETYATVQSLFNQNVRHAYFFAFFFGGGAFPLIALAINWKHWKSVSFWLIAAAAVVYIFGVIAYTSSVNLPLNAITEAWDPQNVPAGWELIREQWNAANAFRVWTSGGAFTLGLMALVIRASK
ncbi:MAG: DUF1772 domain-containing protein [Anaerolineae bacterium]